MRPHVIWRFVAPLLLILMLPLPAQGAVEDGWLSVDQGIDYQFFSLSDPNQVYVARMDRSATQTTLAAATAAGRLASGFETTSGMARRYDGSLSFWNQDWGDRERVVVAINGSFHDVNAVPESGQIQGGWYAKRFDDLGGGSGFAWTLNREAFVGGCVYHRPEKQLIRHVDSMAEYQFQGINRGRGADELIVYTHLYDADTNTNDGGVEVLVEMDRPALVLPTPVMAQGTVRAVYSGQGSTPIPFDHVVLSGTGSGTAALSGLQAGDRIGISQEITHLDFDCVTPNTHSWTKTYTSISGSYAFLRDGAAFAYNDSGATDRHPRTAVAFDDNYIYFIVVNGRNPGVSIGMTIAELATFTRDTLGADWGIAQDGGGSSTMVIRGQVVNDPNGPGFIPLQPRVFLPMIQTGNAEGSSVAAQPEPPAVEWDERAVANALMMVVVEPMARSAAFVSGQAVSTNGSAALRLGPGDNFSLRTTISGGSQGVVVAHAGDLNGVLATGSYWWRVAFGSAVGWMAQTDLQ